MSGSLHVGSVFGYVQVDTVARFRRMRGDELYYPMGWDDNGVPTERRVENFFGVRCDPLLPYFATPQANQQDYHPEWLVAGFGALDTDLVGQFYDQGQWAHAFGMSVIGDLRSGYQSESYRAYKAVRNDEPAQLRDIYYYALLQFFACVQMAGPNLTPKSFEAGCFAYPPRQGEIGLWKFGPGDYTAVSDAREVYWDPEGTSPWNGRKGRYITTLGGTRFADGFPAGEPAFPPPPRPDSSAIPRCGTWCGRPSFPPSRRRTAAHRFGSGARAAPGVRKRTRSRCCSPKRSAWTGSASA